MKALSLAAVALTICSCGGSGGPATTAPPPSARISDTRPVPRDAVQDGGTFTWALQTMPVNFNYNQIDMTLDTYQVIAALMPVTFSENERGTPQWDRNILASEPKLSTEPRQVVTYEINPRA